MEKPIISKKSDIITLFCIGITPKQIYNQWKIVSKKTTYRYYKIYRELKQKLKDDKVIDKLVGVFYELLTNI